MALATKSGVATPAPDSADWEEFDPEVLHEKSPEFRAAVNKIGGFRDVDNKVVWNMRQEVGSILDQVEIDSQYQTEHPDAHGYMAARIPMPIWHEINMQLNARGIIENVTVDSHEYMKMALEIVKEMNKLTTEQFKRGQGRNT